jgi:hypothetical protein
LGGFPEDFVGGDTFPPHPKLFASQYVTASGSLAAESRPGPGTR